ncbi:unnamed protein product [Ostreobium quekettii]|uniref:ER lumen protein retaining receptor n=1 Tax=Ostreobium quekettii TaxID=121088 RepID=A0A8S1IR41_9CHLO|nr:unnamed protein product [Ostreobium quekettii]
MYPDDDKPKTSRDALAVVVKWMKSRSPREKTILSVAAGILVLFILWIVIEDHDFLFVLAEICHFIGIALLVYKLFNNKTCVGISLRSQELTFLFLAVRLYCSFMMEYDIHTVLDALTLLATGWVIYTMMFQLKHTYQVELDTLMTAYVAGPCVLLAIIIHPSTTHIWIHKVLWASCVYIEAVSVLPQLRLMQKNKVVERFTGHYVFCLGLSRFFSCAHWILQIMDGNSLLMHIWGYGPWPVLVLLSEVVQTFILADFCYYYVKSYAQGSGVVRLPENVV